MLHDTNHSTHWKRIPAPICKASLLSVLNECLWKKKSLVEKGIQFIFGEWASEEKDRRGIHTSIKQRKKLKFIQTCNCWNISCMSLRGNKWRSPLPREALEVWVLLAQWWDLFSHFLCCLSKCSNIAVSVSGGDGHQISNVSETVGIDFHADTI